MVTGIDSASPSKLTPFMSKTYSYVRNLLNDKTLGTCQKLAGGSGGGNFKFGLGNEMTHPCNGSEISNPPLDLGQKYHDPPPLV